jgi:phosphohistidine phosphatase
MRRLLLLRHAKSEAAEPGQKDFARALAGRGRAAASLIGNYLARHGLRPDHALVSPARRTRETADLVLAAFGASAPAMRLEPRIYEASPKALLEVLHEAPDDAHTLLLVGHNPGMQQLADSLIAAGDVNARQSLVEKFPTAALAVIDLAVDAWSEAALNSGRLDRFITPKSLDGVEDE